MLEGSQLWFHYINLRLAGSKLQLPGTTLVILLDGYSGNFTVCSSNVPVLEGKPADQARSCRQVFNVLAGFDSLVITFSKPTDRPHSVSVTLQEGQNTTE